MKRLLLLTLLILFVETAVVWYLTNVVGLFR